MGSVSRYVLPSNSHSGRTRFTNVQNDARLSPRDASCPASVYTCDCIDGLNESAVTDIFVTGVVSNSQGSFPALLLGPDAR